MKLKLDIKPDTFKQRGFFGKTIPVHVLHVDLQLTEQEREKLERAGIIEDYFTLQDDPTGSDAMAAHFAETGGRIPVTYAGILKGPAKLQYMSLPAARKALEETKEAMINLKAMFEQDGDPSANSFEL